MAALVDLDDFVVSRRARGEPWARRQLQRVDRAVLTVAGERASSRSMPPDEWVVLLRGAEPYALMAEADSMAEELRRRIVRDSDLTATVSLGAPCDSGPAAEQEARRVNGYKLLLGGDRVITEAPPARPSERIEAELGRLVRAGDSAAAAELVSAGLDRCGPDPRTWLIGQLLYVVDASGPADWVEAAARLRLEDLAGIHERSYLRVWLHDTMRRLVPQPEQRTILAAAERYLAAQFADPDLHLATVAAAVNASPFYVSHLFAQERQTTFLRHLTALRVHQARKLLRESRLSVDLIATHCGYRSTKALREVFKRHVGCTPTEYRRSARHQAVRLAGASGVG